MRSVLLLAVLAMGCGKKGDTEAGGGADAAPKPDEKPILYDNSYSDGGNPIAADAKFKGRRVIFPQVEVDRISRGKDGRAYVAPLSALVVGRVPEPSYFFYLKSDAEAVNIKAGNWYEIVGTCRGYQKDNLWRGGIAGLDWHVDVVDCTVKPSKKTPPKD